MDNNQRITCFVGDAPKRANARDCQGPASYFPCEYCFSKGHLMTISDSHAIKIKNDLISQQDAIKLQIRVLQASGDDDDEHNNDSISTLNDILKNLQEALKHVSKKKTKIVWPPSTRTGEPRTREKITDIINKIEANPNITRDERKGILGKSIFMDVPRFNIVLDIPTEYMHSMCLGKTKKIIQLTFHVGEPLKRITKRKLSSPTSYNDLIKKVKVTYEFSRRARTLDFSVLKAQDYRNIAIFFFDIVIQCIEESAKERTMWLNFSYMIRACVIPNEEFEEISLSKIDQCSKEFYILYAKLFGIANCTYYTHVVGSHIVDIRFHGPLTLTSAFDFESFYGEVRHSFVPGTRSPLKQIMRNILLKRTIGPHCCESSIHYSTKETPLQCNNLVYTYEDGHYQLYKIMNIEESIFSSVKIETDIAFYPETPSLKWELVGVFKFVAFGTELHNIHKENLKGKLIIVNDLIITCPNNILREK